MTPNSVAVKWLIPKRGRPNTESAISLSDDAIDWFATITVAGEDFAIPALAWLLEDAGLLNQAPPDVQQFLRYALSQNTRANCAIHKQCVEIGDALAGAGVSAVLLKGACWLFEDGPGAHDRMLRDIDLLVPRQALQEVRTVLLALGYKTWSSVVPELGHIHDVPLEHRDRRVSVEIHVELTPWVKYLSADDVWPQSKAVTAGLCLPSLMHRLVHNVVHAQIANGDFIAGVLSLRDSLDLGRLMLKAIPAESWINLANSAQERGFFQQLSGALHKAAYVAGAQLPEPFSSDRPGGWHLQRCLLQRRWPALDRIMRNLGRLRRATAWERDAYALGLGSDRSLAAHLLVNQRRLQRIRAALNYKTKSA